MIDETEKRILDRIDANREQIIAFAEDIAAHPEPGFEEVRTAGKTAEFLKSLGYEVKEHLAITGVKGEMKRNGGPTLTVISELDAIGCHSHPMADRRTGVAHACGHHAQMAAMIGCAIAMADPEIRHELDGNVNFLAVPAEEYIDADKRTRLKEKGIECIDFGPDNSLESVDYPIFGEKVANAVISKAVDYGIVCCGTGIGISLAANKVPGIRCAVVSDVFSAKMSKAHNDANMLSLGERVLGRGLALEIVDAWINTEFEGDRHSKRVNMIKEIEERYNK